MRIFVILLSIVAYCIFVFSPVSAGVCNTERGSKMVDFLSQCAEGTSGVDPSTTGAGTK
jgi:dolichyl-phosphate-mannose--protein O-mannosyl transferase